MGIGYWTLFSPRTTCSSLQFSTKVTGEFWAKMKILFVLPLIFASVFAYENAQPSITVEVMRAKWNAWMPQLGFLRGPAGAPGVCACEPNNEYLPPPSAQAGPPGPPGRRGPAGAPGASGSNGVQGSVGPAGPAGASGPAGPAGPAGPQGMKGMTGASGISDSGTRNTATIAQAGYDYPAPQQRFSF